MATYTCHCVVRSFAGARRARLGELRETPGTLAFYAPPHGLLATLEDMCAVLGGSRRVCVAREITKRHEEMWRCVFCCAVHSRMSCHSRIQMACLHPAALRSCISCLFRWADVLSVAFGSSGGKHGPRQHSVAAATKYHHLYICICLLPLIHQVYPWASSCGVQSARAPRGDLRRGGGLQCAGCPSACAQRLWQQAIQWAGGWRWQ